MKSSTNKMSTKTLTFAAILTALVIVLQLLGSFIRFGTFSVSLVLIPIVIGAAFCGKYIGAWLGFVFGLTVLLSGDAALFLGINVPGTIITVLLKGTLCGFFAGLIYELFSKKNVYLGVIAAAIVCPIVNTGVFLLGCFLFFLDYITSLAKGTNVFEFMIISFVGLNFVFELIFNVVLSPAVVRILKISKKM